MRVLITGGTGYLGSALVRACARAGHEPLVFARRASAAALPGQAIDGDIRDLDAVRGAVAAADAVCHTAALVSVWRRDPGEFDAVNVGGLHNVLDACRAHGTRRLLYTSSFLALPPAGATRPLMANDYQRTKVLALEAARAAARSGQPIVLLVPGVIYGPGPATEGNLVGGMIRDHLHGRLPGIAGADRTWPYAFVDDVAEAHVAALRHGRDGIEYVLGGENAPQARMFEIVRDATGRALPRRLPFRLVAAAASIDGIRARLTGHPPRITRGAVEIFRHDWPLDSARSVEELSLRVTPLEEGIRRVLAALS